MADRLDAILKRFKVYAAAEADQRARELDDLKFEAGDQWPQAIKTERAGTTQGVPVAPRPCLTINKIEGPIQLMVNQARGSHLAIQINPKGDGASQDDAELRQDLIRQIEVDSRANMVRGWALERAGKCGRGVYRVLTRFVDDEYGMDQEIVLERVLNQAQVYLDPFASQPDWSDGRGAFITEDLPESVFLEQFPKSKFKGLGGEEFVSLGDSAPGWATVTGETRTIRVAEHFYVEMVDRTRLLLKGQEEPIWADEHEPVSADQIDQTRVVPQRVVKWCKLTALEILSEQDWEGQFIPIVPVLGKERNINGVRRFDGMVGSAKDSQRMYNYQASALVETIALAPKAPFVMAEGQMEGHEEQWRNLNVKNYSAIEYKPITLGGSLAPPPQRNVVEPPIQAITHAILQADADIKATTQTYDPSLGAMSAGQRSGKQTLALQKQAELAGSNYLVNLAEVSMTYEAKVLLDLIPRIYSRQGRLVQLLGIDDAPRQVLLNQPFKRANGKPVPLNGEAYNPKAGHEHYDLSRGSFTASVSVGKNVSTRREEGALMMSQLAESAPQFVPLYADLWVKSMDFPEARQIADRLQKMLPPQLKGSDDQANDPQQQLQQMQQQLQQLGQQHDLLVKELDAKTKEIEQDQVKARATMQTAELNNASKERIAAIQAHAGLIEAEFKANAAAATVAMKAEVDRILLQMEQSHEHIQNTLDRITPPPLDPNRPAEPAGVSA